MTKSISKTQNNKNKFQNQPTLQQLNLQKPKQVSKNIKKQQNVQRRRRPKTKTPPSRGPSQKRGSPPQKRKIIQIRPGILCVLRDVQILDAEAVDDLVSGSEGDECRGEEFEHC